MDVERLERALETAASAAYGGVALVARDDEDPICRSWGLANRADAVPVTRATRFGVASVSKMFTAVAIGRVVDCGSVAFATRAAEILSEPWLDPAITLHHLLSHTSGLANYFDEQSGYERVWEQRPSYRYRRPADFVPLFSGLPPVARPGERFEYCDAGFVLLALVVEAVTGLSFVDAVAREVLAPAGMADSGYFALDEPRPRVAVGYAPAVGGGWRSNVYAIPVVGGGDGGAFASADDLVRFFAALEGDRLLAPATRDALTSAHVRSDAGWRYGYGFFVDGEGDALRYGHTGEDPGTSAMAFRWPEQHTTAVLLTNATEGVAPLWPAIRDAVGA